MKKREIISKQKLTESINKVNDRTPMVFYHTMFIFVVSCVTGAILMALYTLLNELGVIGELNLYLVVLLFLVCSIAISTSLVRGFGNKIIFRSLRRITEFSNSIAEGDFSKRLTPPREKELADICQSLNDMADKLGRNELVAWDFISNVSHQFRTPLATIIGYAQLLQDPSLPESERREYIAIIEEKTKALSKLVNSILELSKLEYQSITPATELFRLDEQLRRCIISFENRFAEKNITVVADLDHAECFASPELMAEVWSNIIENAIEFSPVGGRIKVTLRNIEGSACVEISDEGAGMDEETLAHVFDRFYRGKNRKLGGNGLGMAIAKRIITLHGFSIEAKSAPGQGSTFIVKTECR